MSDHSSDHKEDRHPHEPFHPDSEGPDSAKIDKQATPSGFASMIDKQATPGSMTAEGGGGGGGGGGGHRAHHLKYGHVALSGFDPSQHDWTEHDLAVCPSDEVRDRDIRRERLDAEARRIHASRRYLFRKPRALQYFRGKTLVRDDKERGSERVELFFDLIFVGIIAVLAQEVVDAPSGATLVRYLITYCMAWFLWSFARETSDIYFAGDFYQICLLLFVMACLIVFGSNAIHIEQNHSEGPARAATVVAYVLAEVAMYGTQFFYSFYVKAYRTQVRAYGIPLVITWGIWIGSIFVNVKPAIAMAVVALVLEYGSWIYVYSPAFKRHFKLRYSSAMAIEHEIERMRDFFTLVLGEAIYSIVYGDPAGLGFTPGTGRAVLCLLIASVFLLFYTVGSGSKKLVHPLRRSMFGACAWLILHIPLVSALTMFGDACGLFVAAVEVQSGTRWILCETYAMAMVCLWCLSMIEIDKDEPGMTWRMLPRILAAILAIFLPLSPFRPEGEGEHGTASTEHAAFRMLSILAEATPTEETVHESTRTLSTTAILAILAAVSFAILIWEWVSALDGPSTPSECAPDDMLEGDKYTPPHALRTPRWTGFPTLFEPGMMHFDRSKQTDPEQTTTDGVTE